MIFTMLPTVFAEETDDTVLDTVEAVETVDATDDAEAAEDVEVDTMDADDVDVEVTTANTGSAAITLDIGSLKTAKVNGIENFRTTGTTWFIYTTKDAAGKFS